MIGSIFLMIVVAVVAAALFALLRNALVEGVTAVGQLIAGILDVGLKVSMRVINLLTQLIHDSYGALRDIHGDLSAEYGRFWDVFIPILFLILLGVLAYADYQLFAARIGPLLGLNQLPQTSDALLNLVLGALYVVTLFVLGYALSDAYGHSPAGRSLIFGRFGEPVKKVLWGSVAVLGVATLALAIWTFEITVLNANDDFAAGVFFITFSLLAVFATALTVAPSLIGVLALLTVLMEAARLLLWLVASILWMVLNVADKLVEAIVKVVIDIPARLGDALYAAAWPRRQREPWVQREPISPLVGNFPLLAEVVPSVQAAPTSLPEASAPVESVQVERDSARASRPVMRTGGHGADVIDVVEERTRTNGLKPGAGQERPGGSTRSDAGT